MNRLEHRIIDIVSAVAPWLAPIVPAYLVFKNTQSHLGYPWPISLVTACAVEFIGLASVHTSIQFWTWNNEKRKIDDDAPFWVAIGAGAFYILVVLTVNALLEVAGNTANVWANAILSLLSVDAAIIIALRASHARRVAEIADEKIERKQARKRPGSAPEVPEPTPEPVRNQRKYAELTAEERRNLLTLPNGEAVKLYGVSDRSIREWRALASQNGTAHE